MGDTEITVAGTPQQNGLVEHMNRTTLDKVRCMFSSLKLSKSFWAEVVQTTTCLINRSSSPAIGFKTLKEMWSGRSANCSNLRVFWCLSYSHVNEGKLKPRAIKCVFLG